eukprot:sb/3471691/
MAVESFLSSHHADHGGGMIVYNRSLSTCLFDTSNFSRQMFSKISSAVFALCPLLLNSVSYSLILKRLRKKRNDCVRMISIRAVLICVCFTMSWLPFVILYDILNLVGFRHYWYMALYLNCLSDPILYAFTTGLIRARLEQIKVHGLYLKRRVSRLSNAWLISPLDLAKVAPAPPQAAEE